MKRNIWWIGLWYIFYRYDGTLDGLDASVYLLLLQIRNNLNQQVRRNLHLRDAPVSGKHGGQGGPLLHRATKNLGELDGVLSPAATGPGSEDVDGPTRSLTTGAVADDTAASGTATATVVSVVPATAAKCCCCLKLHLRLLLQLPDTTLLLLLLLSLLASGITQRHRIRKVIKRQILPCESTTLSQQRELLRCIMVNYLY